MTQPMPISPTNYKFAQILADLEGEQLEIAFLASVIPHHRDAIEMVQLELKNGSSPDIRTHAENILANQQHQIDQFTSWLKDWYGLTPEEAVAKAPENAREMMQTMQEEMQKMLKELAEVPAGEDFDVSFVREMIPHHNSGIVEFLEAQSRAVHPQLRISATEGITTQQAQAANFRTWLAGRS